jgi:hypothetical protein
MFVWLGGEVSGRPLGTHRPAPNRKETYMTSRWDWQENALPTCQQVATALLHLLWRSPQPLTPREAYRELATQFALNRGHLNMRMRNQNELAWETVFDLLGAT